MSRNSKGFSLTETMVSMGIALVLTTASLPMADSTLILYRLRNDSHQIAAQCQNARFLAVAGNVSHRLHMNGSVLEVQKLAGGGYTTVQSYRLSAGISVAAGWSSDPVFSPRRTVLPAASITLANSKGAKRTVSVSVTGVVREQ